MMNVAEAWGALVGEGRTEPGWHARRVHLGSACDIRSAIQAPDGIPAVLFEVAAKSVPPGAQLPKCVGFDLTVETMIPGQNGRVRLCLALRDRRYRDVFGTLADDVAAAVAVATTETLGIKALLGRLNTWERFVSRFGPDHLSDEQQVGLFAELLFFTTEVIPTMDAASAVRSWRGPYREAHDFRFRAAAVEIKASSARTPQSFRVANLDQLDIGSLDLLLVHHVTLDADSVTGKTLSEIVRLARNAIGASDMAAASDFDDALLEAGYLVAHAESYDRKFEATGLLWLNVSDLFPKLTRSSVPFGIAEAVYSVSMQLCAPFAIEAALARDLIKARL